MKENNFRAWNDRTNRMLDGDMIESEPMISTGLSYGKLFIAETYRGDWLELNVMQSTGLRDRFGKEIFEGDILQQNVNCGGMLVVWDNGKYVLRGTYDGDLAFYAPACSLIGNIHENPELLTK